MFHPPELWILLALALPLGYMWATSAREPRRNRLARDRQRDEMAQECGPPGGSRIAQRLIILCLLVTLAHAAGLFSGVSRLLPLRPGATPATALPQEERPNQKSEDPDAMRADATVEPQHAEASGTPGAERSAHPSDEMSVTGPPSITAEQIDAVLEHYSSPATGSGQTMIDLGIEHGIDPAFCLAFFIHESGAGTQGVAAVTRSVGNIRWTPDAPYPNYQGFRLYGSWEEGMRDWYRLIRVLYIDSWGLTTVEQILPVYAPPSDGNDTAAYVQTVRGLVERWRAQP